MSRIGKAPINIPAGVTVTIKDNVLTVKGKLGELTQEVKDIAVKQEDGHLVFETKDTTKDQNAKHGLYRALVNNMVVGVSEGFTKELELVGVGYRAANQGQKLDLALGFSHNIILELPKEIKLETINEKGKNPIIKLTSCRLQDLMFFDACLHGGRLKNRFERFVIGVRALSACPNARWTR